MKNMSIFENLINVVVENVTVTPVAAFVIGALVAAVLQYWGVFVIFVLCAVVPVYAAKNQG